MELLLLLMPVWIVTGVIFIVLLSLSIVMFNAGYMEHAYLLRNTAYGVPIVYPFFFLACALT